MYRGGEAAFLKDQAEFRLGQLKGTLDKLRGMRLNPGNIGEVLGELQGIRSFVESKVYSQVGDRGVKPGRGWWHGSFAGYQFVSAVREDAGNWVYIKGITRDGHIVELQGSKQDDQETVIDEDVKQGASYSGAAFMAEKGNVPKEVFRDEMKSAAFGMQYSREWDKAYQGRLSKEDLVRVATQLQGRIGGRLSLRFFGANGSIGKSSAEALQDAELSSTDILTRAAMDINMSNMTIRQKEAAYQEVNRMIRDLRTDKAEDLPSASYMRHRAEKPLGEIKKAKE